MESFQNRCPYHGVEEWLSMTNHDQQEMRNFCSRNKSLRYFKNLVQRDTCPIMEVIIIWYRNSFARVATRNLRQQRNNLSASETGIFVDIFFFIKRKRSIIIALHSPKICEGWLSLINWIDGYCKWFFELVWS